MALIKCPECGRQVSDKALTCPNCGCPIGTTINQAKKESLNYPAPVDHGWVNKWYKRKKKFVITCCVLAPFTLFISLIALAASHIVERSLNGYTVLVYCGMANHIVIEGKEIEKIYSPKTVYGNLPDGTNVVVTCDALTGSVDIFFESPAASVGQQIIINNVENNTTVVKKGKQPERSDMEKILIKNAKIDALASIDPTDTKKAKEQIDIVNKLDNLD